MTGDPMRDRSAPGLPVPSGQIDGVAHRPGTDDTGRIRVALVDDHHLVREGLRLVLANAPGIDVVGEAATHAGAFELLTGTRPDVLLLDLTFPEGDALPVVRALQVRYPDLRILVLTMDRGSETVRQALVAGASGYVVKGATSTELIEAIRAVARGDRYLHSSVTSVIVDDSIRWVQAGSSLSMREREILSLLAGGRSPAEIARMLGISVHTVRRHIANLSGKLGLHGRTELSRYAVRHGLVREA